MPPPPPPPPPKGSKPPKKSSKKKLGSSGVMKAIVSHADASKLATDGHHSTVFSSKPPNPPLNSVSNQVLNATTVEDAAVNLGLTRPPEFGAAGVVVEYIRRGVVRVLAVVEREVALVRIA